MEETEGKDNYKSLIVILLHVDIRIKVSSEKNLLTEAIMGNLCNTEKYCRILGMSNITSRW